MDHKETYNDYGWLHSFNDVPSRIVYTLEKNVHSLSWYKNGLLHRNGGRPCYLEFNHEGVLVRASWMINGYYSNINDNPSRIVCNFPVTTCSVEWFDKNRYKQRSGNQPNHVHYNFSTGVRRESCFNDAEEDKALFHNLSGPALADYKNNELVFAEYHIMGTYYENKTEWLASREVQDHLRIVKNKTRASVITDVAF